MNSIQRNIAKLAEYDTKSHANLLTWTTLIIWACSLAAEVGTFAFNKKLPEKEKGFIIRQELVSGGVSLGVMYLLADRFKKGGEWLVKTARLLPEELPKQWRTEAAVQKILEGDKQFLKKQLQGKPAWINKLGGFQKGVGVISGTLGAIIAFNISTPLISNKIASYFQNKALAQRSATSVALKPGSGYLKGQNLNAKALAGHADIGKFPTFSHPYQAYGSPYRNPFPR